MLQRPSKHRHPLSSLVMLMLIAVSGFIVCTFIGFVLVYLFFGSEALTSLRNGIASSKMQRLFLAFYSVGTFVVPPVVLARTETNNIYQYLKVRIPRPWYLLVLAILIMLCITPFIEFTVFLNQQMKLPSLFESVENWMRYKEMEAEVLTKQLLVMNSVGGLLANLLVIAVIPALGEELIFRGCIQKIIAKWTGNEHLGVWVSAIIFSTIHFQFFGFLPRLLLGVLFGYLLVYSSSIWVPVFAHFYNNASAVFAAFMLQRQGKTLENLTKPEFQQWYLVCISVIFTALLLALFRNIASKHLNSKDERQLG